VKSKILATLAAAALLAVGCEQGAQNAPSVQDYEQKRAELGKRKGDAAPTVAQRKQSAAPAPPAEHGSGLVASGDNYAYDATGKRDPFRSFVLDEAARRESHERGPLEQFDLSQLTLVAVVWGTERPRALVTDPSGRGYVVQEGTPIGKNEGEVIRISDNTLLVRETYVDYLGEATSKEIEMRVRSKAQGG
jgi:type IV pilus assembly protein PilP